MFTLEAGRNILRGHEHDERHVEVVRDGGEGETVVGVNHQEGWAAGEGEKVSGVQATVLLIFKYI